MSTYRRYYQKGGVIKKQDSTLISAATNHRREKPVWQRRFWEHMIRDDEDRRLHMDYIHYNPVKHGYVSLPGQWRAQWILLEDEGTRFGLDKGIPPEATF